MTSRDACSVVEFNSLVLGGKGAGSRRVPCMSLNIGFPWYLAKCCRDGGAEERELVEDDAAAEPTKQPTVAMSMESGMDSGL